MYRLGCDIGSTTVKTVLLSDADAVLAGFYERHFSDIPQTLVKMLASASEITKNAPVRCVFTGSGGFISGLACGKPIRGKVIFLGGSMFFLPEPKKRFAKTLNLTDGDAISPENAHLFAALSSYRRSKR